MSSAPTDDAPGGGEDGAPSALADAVSRPAWTPRDAPAPSIATPGITPAPPPGLTPHSQPDLAAAQAPDLPRNPPPAITPGLTPDPSPVITPDLTPDASPGIAVAAGAAATSLPVPAPRPKPPIVPERDGGAFFTEGLRVERTAGRACFVIIRAPERPPQRIYVHPAALAHLLELAAAPSWESGRLWSALAAIPLERPLPSRRLEEELRALLTTFGGDLRS